MLMFHVEVKRIVLKTTRLNDSRVDSFFQETITLYKAHFQI